MNDNDHPLMRAIRGCFAANEADIEALRADPDFLLRVFGLGFACGMTHLREQFQPHIDAIGKAVDR